MLEVLCSILFKLGRIVYSTASVTLCLFLHQTIMFFVKTQRQVAVALAPNSSTLPSDTLNPKWLNRAFIHLHPSPSNMRLWLKLPAFPAVPADPRRLQSRSVETAGNDLHRHTAASPHRVLTGGWKTQCCIRLCGRRLFSNHQRNTLDEGKGCEH